MLYKESPASMLYKVTSFKARYVVKMKGLLNNEKTIVKAPVQQYNSGGKRQNEITQDIAITNKIEHQLEHFSLLFDF